MEEGRCRKFVQKGLDPFGIRGCVAYTLRVASFRQRRQVPHGGQSWAARHNTSPFLKPVLLGGAGRRVSPSLLRRRRSFHPACWRLCGHFLISGPRENQYFPQLTVHAAGPRIVVYTIMEDCDEKEWSSTHGSSSRTCAGAIVAAGCSSS